MRANDGRGHVWAYILLAALLKSSPCGAQGTTDSVAAEALFQEAVQLLESDHTAEACPKFAESHRLDPQGGVAFELGSCYEKLGKYASAWGAFNEAVARWRLRNDKRVGDAQQRAASLEPRLPKLAILVPASSRVPGLLLKRDGVELGQGQWESAVPLDPGEVVIEASAPGRTPWKRVVKIERAGLLNLEVPALVEAKASSKGHSDSNEAGIPFWGAQRIAAVNAAGLGIIGLAIGIGSGIDASQKLEASNAYCQTGSGAAPDICALEARPLREGVRAAGTASTVAFIAGGTLIAGATVLWLTAPHSASASNTKAAVWVSPSIAGVVVGGQF